MANKEIWDYLSAVAVTPDYNAVLSVTPQKELLEEGEKKQIVHLGDDNSEEVISLSDDSVFYVSLQWNALGEADAGTLFDFYHDTAKGNGMARSFKWTNASEIADPHIYTVRFASPLPRKKLLGNLHRYINISLKILGRAP